MTPQEQEELMRLRNDIKEIRKELKHHIANCPYSSIQVMK